LHIVEPDILTMVRAEIEAALSHLQRISIVCDIDREAHDKGRRVAAVIVILEQSELSYQGSGNKPWETVPWLKCAIQLLDRTQGMELAPVREHLSAVCDLLSPI
jgi:hypothetical protein